MGYDRERPAAAMAGMATTNLFLLMETIHLLLLCHLAPLEIGTMHSNGHFIDATGSTSTIL